MFRQPLTLAHPLAEQLTTMAVLSRRACAWRNECAHNASGSWQYWRTLCMQCCRNARNCSQCLWDTCLLWAWRVAPTLQTIVWNYWRFCYLIWKRTHSKNSVSTNLHPTNELSSLISQNWGNACYQWSNTHSCQNMKRSRRSSYVCSELCYNDYRTVINIPGQFGRLLDLLQTLEQGVSKQANLSINKRSPWAARRHRSLTTFKAPHNDIIPGWETKKNLTKRRQGERWTALLDSRQRCSNY